MSDSVSCAHWGDRTPLEQCIGRTVKVTPLGDRDSPSIIVIGSIFVREDQVVFVPRSPSYIRHDGIMRDIEWIQSYGPGVFSCIDPKDRKTPVKFELLPISREQDC